MSTVQEIEQAIHQLDNSQIEELARFLEEECRLRGGQLYWPPPRTFSREQVESWLHEDGVDTQALRTKLNH